MSDWANMQTMLVPVYAAALGVPEYLCQECEVRQAALNLGVCLPCHKRTSTMVYELRKLAVTTPWGDAQKLLLEHYIARHPLRVVAGKLGVSLATVKVVCRGLCLNVAQIRHDVGTVSLLRLAQRTGYQQRQLLRAGKALKQRWAGLRGHKLIEAGHQAALMHYLANLPTPFISLRGVPGGRWSRLFDRCVVCATDGNSVSQRHHSRGRCVRCHNGERRVVDRFIPGRHQAGGRV